MANDRTRRLPVLSTGGAVHVNYTESDVKAIVVNGTERAEPDEHGDINIVVPEKVEVTDEVEAGETEAVPTSDAVARAIGEIKHPVATKETALGDFVIADRDENPILTVDGGHVKTANFDSSKIVTKPISNANLVVADGDENPILTVANGHIKTANFDSANIAASGVHPVETRKITNAKLIIADENERALLTVTNDGHVVTSAFNSAEIGSGATSGDGTSGGGTSGGGTALPPNSVVVIGMLGQSNMAGRGEVTAEHPIDAPDVIAGAGWEYRACSAPNTLSPITKTLGVNENGWGLSESTKTGGCAPAFANRFYQLTGIPVVLVSASKGGTTIAQWQPGANINVENYLNAACKRINDACTYLTSRGYNIVHRYVLWCQGESDGDNSTTAADYKARFANMVEALKSRAQIEKVMMVRIGYLNESNTPNKYQTIIDAQGDICREREDTVMVSTILTDLKRRGLMKDAYHYYQEGYNLMGYTAARGVAMTMLTGCDPMDDF